MRTSILGLVMAALCACTIPEAEAPEELAEAWCKKKRQCDRGDFDSTWDNRRDCEDDIADIVESLQDFYDLLDCQYDSREAGRARRDINSASCANFVDGDFDDPELYDCQ